MVKTFCANARSTLYNKTSIWQEQRRRGCIDQMFGDEVKRALKRKSAID
jgi:hypothetical protein